jgi:hypothetical protein
MNKKVVEEPIDSLCKKVYLFYDENEKAEYKSYEETLSKLINSENPLV